MPFVRRDRYFVCEMRYSAHWLVLAAMKYCKESCDSCTGVRLEQFALLAVAVSSLAAVRVASVPSRIRGRSTERIVLDETSQLLSHAEQEAQSRVHGFAALGHTAHTRLAHPRRVCISTVCI
jgi:hypothetical protein